MITNISFVIQGMGYYFVEFCALYGYGDVLALLGRCQQELFMLIERNMLVLSCLMNSLVYADCNSGSSETS